MSVKKKGEEEKERERNASNDLSAFSDLDFYKKEKLNLIPLRYGDKRPLGEWKEFQHRKTTEGKMDAFFEGALKEKNNLGVVCGEVSDNLFILDFDNEELYHRFFTKPDGLVVVKTGRGYHVYFKAEHPVKTLKIYDSEGREVITLKGEGSYVVAPPSLHPSGSHYRFVQHSEIQRLEDDPRQQVIGEARRLGLTVAGKDTEIDIKTLLKGVPKGNRDNSLMYLIHFLRRGGVSQEEALKRCKAWNELNLPLLDDTSVRYKVDYHYGLAEPYHYFYSLDPRRWNISENLTLIDKGEREEAQEHPHLTDLGNAKRVVRDHEGEILYCYTRKKWLIWNGFRWAIDKSGEIRRLAKTTVVGIYGEAGDLDDEAQRKALAKHAVQSESKQRIDAMLNLAESEREFAKIIDDFDQNKWLLGVRNGTINLNTCEFQESKKEDMISMCAGI